MDITNKLRASVIDWLFEVGKKLKIEDNNVIFQAVSIMDRFYNNEEISLPTKDLQLTAVASFFIASKNLEVQPVDLKTCMQKLCYNKYSKNQFLKKESDIRKIINYENEAPTLLEFAMLYIKMIKHEV